MASTTLRIITLALAILTLAAPAASARPMRDLGNAYSRVPTGSDADPALAAEQYYASYGEPQAIAPSPPQPTGDTEWPIIGLVGAGAVLLALGSGTAIRKVRGRRRTAGAAA